MDEKQLLKEIAYYSQIVNQHKRLNETTNTKSNYNKSISSPHSQVQLQSNKYKYVKKTPLPSNTNKILINPNFKQVVHINPKFCNGTKIHVNPKMLNNYQVNPEILPYQTHVNPKILTSQTHNPKILTSQTHNTKVLTSQTHANQKILNNQTYVNPKILNNQTYVNPKILSNQAHVNPKILSYQAHVNPKILSNQTHVNPKILSNQTHVNPKILSNQAHVNSKILSNQAHVNAKILSNRAHFNPKMSSVHNLRIGTQAPSTNPFTFTATKNLKTHSQTVPITPVRKRRVSIRSKYKIVKSSSIKTTPRSSIYNKPSIKNKYKIDRRSITTVVKSLTKRKIIKFGISDIVRNTLFNNRSWNKAHAINHFRMNNTRLTNISGILYKKSQNKLQKVLLNMPEKKTIRHKKYLISTRGQKYIMGSNNKTLKLVSSTSTNSSCSSLKRVSVNGVTYIKKSPNTFVRYGNTISPQIRKLKYKNNKLQRNQLRKNNKPCPVYRRFGKCRRQKAGRCVFQHNPNQIFLCKKFLQGACVDNDCLLSHKVSSEKMPTCKYYLDGCCVKSDCPYLHVKINPRADICRKFLEGFCEDGVECHKRHQFLCPDFERNGKCLRRKCIYPHKVKIEVKSDKEKCANAKQIIINVATPTIEQPISEQIERERYYVDNEQFKNEPPLPTFEKRNDSQVSDENSDNESDKICQRPKLGILPSFIPLS